MYRAAPSGDASATIMLQPSIVAWSTSTPATGVCVITWKPCEVRNSLTLPGALSTVSFSPTSFHVKVNGTRKTTSHLSADLGLTSYTYQANGQRQSEDQQIRDDLAGLAMNCAVVTLTQAHQSDPRHIDRDDRRGRNKTADDIPTRGPARLPLTYEHPSQECERHVRQRRAIWKYDQRARPIDERHNVSLAAGAQQQSDQPGVAAENHITEKPEQEATPEHRHGGGKKNHSPASTRR